MFKKLFVISSMILFTSACSSEGFSTSDSSTGGISEYTGGTSSLTENSGGITSSISSGGTSGLTATGGSSVIETGGNSTCVPRTCDEVAISLTGSYDPTIITAPTACGIVSDNCGGILDCGDCLSGSCGDITDSICPTRCYKETEVGLTYTCGRLDYDGQHLWRCESEIPPVGITGCVSVSDEITSAASAWCCDPN